MKKFLILIIFLFIFSNCSKIKYATPDFINNSDSVVLKTIYYSTIGH
jgi:hypothetical protein